MCHFDTVIQIRCSVKQSLNKKVIVLCSRLILASSDVREHFYARVYIISKTRLVLVGLLYQYLKAPTHPDVAKKQECLDKFTL